MKKIDFSELTVEDFDKMKISKENSSFEEWADGLVSYCLLKEGDEINRNTLVDFIKSNKILYDKGLDISGAYSDLTGIDGY